MTSAEATVYGSGQFWLQDGDTAPPVESWDQSNGLIITASVGAAVLTGEVPGAIQVTLDVRSHRPQEADEPLAFGDGTTWDDIVEVSLVCNHGPLRVCDFDVGFIEALPALDTVGPGTYRVRVHVHGRDSPSIDEDGMPTPTDRFLIVCWPAPHEPPFLIRLTDRRGLGTRMSWLGHAAPDLP
jgi:hypothetical protein